MAEIFQFPAGAAERDWRSIEITVRDFVKRGGGSEHMADWVLSDVRPRLEAIGVVTDFVHPESAAPAVAEMKSAMEKFKERALLQILLLEFALYGANWRGDGEAA